MVVVIFRCFMTKQKYIWWWLYLGASWPNRSIYGGGYTGCPRRNVRDFGRVFLMLNYTDKTQNTYVQSRTVTEIMAREKCGIHWGRHTVRSFMVKQKYILRWFYLGVVWPNRSIYCGGSI